MSKAVVTLGERPSLILDREFLESSRVQEGDEYSVAVDEGGTITLTPSVRFLDPEEAGEIAQRWIEANSELFRRLS